eukprot:jgi/Mesvir1/20577/Mv14818-RA.1
MAPHPSQDITLERLMAVPGVGAQVMAALPVPDRVRLRRTCRTFLAAVDDSLSNLTELFGEDVAGEGCRPGTSGLSWLLSKCPNLTTISVAARADHTEPWVWRDRFSLSWQLFMTEKTSDKIAGGILSLEDIAGRYPGLKYLNVAGCLDVTDAGLMALARSCPGLEALDVSCTRAGDAGITAVATSCPGLRRLAVSRCYNVSNASMTCVGVHCPQLEVLYLMLSRVTDVGLMAVARRGSPLRALEAPFTVTDVAMTLLAENCPHLEQLGMSFCCSVSNASIKRIAAACPGLQRFDASRCQQVTDDGIMGLAENCPGLLRLSVAGTRVTDMGIVEIARRCERLEYLNVNGCPRVTETSIKAVARGCRRLRHLSVAECPRVKDAGICRVAESCPGMQELNIRQAGVTGASLRAIAANCQELRYLDMGGCGKGGRNLASLAEGCPKLEHLDISSSPSVSQKSIVAVSRHCTRLRVFRARSLALPSQVWAKLVKGRGAGLRVLDLAGSGVMDPVVRLVSWHCLRLLELIVRESKMVTDWSGGISGLHTGGARHGV